MKTTARAGLEKAFAAAVRQGAADAILHRSGIVYETTRGNLFWIKEGVVYTPDLKLGCLPGVLRGWVIRQLRRWRIPLRTGLFTLDNLEESDAVVRTNALIGVEWVKEISGLKKWRRPVPPLILRLHQTLRAIFTELR